MKYFFFSFCLGVVSFSAKSQITYVDTDWIIDQTQVMVDGEMDTLELDFDQDGTKDMRISSWSNHQSGIQTVTEVLMLDAVGFGGLQVQGSYIADCPASGFTYQNIVGYIFTSDSPNPYTNQYVKMPFRFQGITGIHYGLLYVRYVNNSVTGELETITIEGYTWNQTPGGLCDCNSTGWLSLSEYQMDELQGNFHYYNMLGQQISNPQGLVLKVYESGLSKKVYVIN